MIFHAFALAIRLPWQVKLYSADSKGWIHSVGLDFIQILFHRDLFCKREGSIPRARRIDSIDGELLAGLSNGITFGFDVGIFFDDDFYNIVIWRFLILD